jgi:cold shock CspA family protein
LILAHQFSVLLFGDHRRQPTPSPKASAEPPPQSSPNHRKTNNRHWKILIVASHKLAVEKALDTLTLVDRAYSLGIWPSPEEKDKWQHDLGVFPTFDNLNSLSLELLGADKTVVAEVKINFGQHVDGKTSGARTGTEVPVLDRKLVTGHRVLVQWKDGNQDQYRHLLRLNWQTAETLRRRQGDEFANSQARKTGGRQSGTIFTSKDSRHTLIVTHPIGSKGFGFGDCPDLGLTNVFLHSRHLRGLKGLKLGQRVTAQIVQLPQGIQAREVRAR